MILLIILCLIHTSLVASYSVGLLFVEFYSFKGFLLSDCTLLGQILKMRQFQGNVSLFDPLEILMC